MNELPFSQANFDLIKIENEELKLKNQQIKLVLDDLYNEFQIYKNGKVFFYLVFPKGFMGLEHKIVLLFLTLFFLKKTKGIQLTSLIEENQILKKNLNVKN